MKDFVTKIIQSKYSILYLILFIGGLYYLQEKVITPLVMEVVKSDLFFEKPIEENEPLGKLDGKTERSGYAMASCREAVKKEGDLPANAEFSDDYETWALGNRQYLIRSKVKLADAQKGQIEKLYACTVRMTGEKQEAPESWSLLGLDFNPSEE